MRESRISIERRVANLSARLDDLGWKIAAATDPELLALLQADFNATMQEADTLLDAIASGISLMADAAGIAALAAQRSGQRRFGVRMTSSAVPIDPPTIQSLEGPR